MRAHAVLSSEPQILHFGSVLDRVVAFAMKVVGHQLHVAEVVGGDCLALDILPPVKPGTNAKALRGRGASME